MIEAAPAAPCPRVGGGLAVEGGDHQEVAPVQRAGPEGGPGEHQQHVAGRSRTSPSLPRTRSSARWIAMTAPPNRPRKPASFSVLPTSGEPGAITASYRRRSSAGPDPAEVALLGRARAR